MKYIVCVATASRSAQAAVLRQSCLKHMPDHVFKLVEIEEIPGESIYKTVALKRIETCLELFGAGVSEVIHMGADWVVYNCLYLNRHCEALFMPHVIYELPSQPITMVRAGVINSDFQMWRRTSSVIVFLDEMERGIRDLHSTNIFEYEQHWLPFALSILDAELINNPDSGVSFYNLHERAVEKLFLNSFHFSGFDVNKPELSIHAPNQELEPAVKELLEAYRRRVIECAR